MVTMRPFCFYRIAMFPVSDSAICEEQDVNLLNILLFVEDCSVIV